MKKIKIGIAAGLAAMMLFGCAACERQATEPSVSSGEESSASMETDATAASGWSAEGIFVDEDGNNLVLYHMTVENGYERDSWSATIMLEEDMIGGELQEKDGVLAGDFVTLDEEGDVSEGIAVTLTQENDGVYLQMEDGTGYHFTPDDTDYSDMEGEALLPFFQYYAIYETDGFDAVEAAAYDYLSFNKFEEYDPAHAIVPFVQIVEVDETDPTDVLIYGDYWLWEVELQDDTLVAVSGGHCPGIIHAERFGEGDTAVYDASDIDMALTDDDAVTIFGEYFDQYQRIASDQDTREAKTAQVIADYVKTNEIEVTKYQLPGEEPKELP